MFKLSALTFALTAFALAPACAQQETFSEYVDASGAISRPTDFKTNPDWMHMGAWAVVNENGEGNGIHNVYTTKSAVEYYKANGVFPDGAPVVKEVRGAAAAQLSTGRAHWSTDPQVWFVWIKDAKGRFEDNPLWGDGWGWALFNADEPAKQVATDYRADCLGCHVPAEESDWMYVYGYAAVLGEKAAAFAPQ